MRKLVDWGNLEELPLSLVLDKLEEHIDHIRFAVVCKNWLSIAKLNHKNHQFRISIPPMIMSVPIESNSSRSLYSLLSHKEYSIQFSSIEFIICHGSSFGWLSLVHSNGAITLLNPFKYGIIPPISLPPLESPPLKYLRSVTLSADPIISPDDYVAVVIYNYRHMAFRRANQPFWIPIVTNLSYFNDVAFYKGMLVADAHSDTIQSFKFNTPPPDRSNDPNFTYYENITSTKYRVRAQDYAGQTHLVKSLNGDIWMVKRYLIYVKKLSYGLDVYKLKLDAQSGKLVQMNRLKSLGDNILFIGYRGNSFSLSASCFSKLKKDSVYFLCEGVSEDLGFGVYNVKDGSYQIQSLPPSFKQVQFFWALPQFQWD